MFIDCFISYYHLAKGIKRLLLISAKLFNGHISIPSFCGLSISQMKEDQFKVFPQNSLKLVMIYTFPTSFAISEKTCPRLGQVSGKQKDDSYKPSSLYQYSYFYYSVFHSKILRTFSLLPNFRCIQIQNSCKANVLTIYILVL